MADPEPLLQAYWREVEEQPREELPEILTATQLQTQFPNQLVQYLKHHGIKKLGEARIRASDLQGLGLGPGSMLLTRGSSTCALNWEADWNVHPVPEDQPAAAAEAAAAAVIAPSPAVVVAVPGTQDPQAGGGSSARGGLEGATRAWWSRLRHLKDCGKLATHDAPTVSSSAGGTASRSRPLLPSLPPPPTVVVEAYVVAVQDAAASGEQGLLRPVLRRWQLGSCSVGAFGLPAVQAVVAYKWSAFARRRLLQQLAAYGLWLGAFTGFMMLFTSGDAALPDTELLSTWKGRAAVVCEVLALVGMAPFALSELFLLWAYGLWGWLSLWNLLDLSTYGMQVAITVLHLGVYTDGPWRLTLAVAVQAVLLTVRLTYFSRVFRSTTFDFMGALQAVGSEVGWYMCVLLLLMWGFACAFYTIFRSDDATEKAFDSLPISMLTMLNYAIGGTAYYMQSFLASSSPATAIALCTVYQFLVSMVLMSLLTGVMTNALARATQQEAVAMVLNRAQLIDELETVLPFPLLSPITAFGGTRALGRDGNGGSCAPLRYVHVLRVNPRSLEGIDGVEGLWPASITPPPEPATNGEGGGGSGKCASRSGSGILPRPASATGSLGGGSGAQGVAGGVATERLEAQVRQLEGQLAELRGVVRQLVDLNGDVRSLLLQQRQQQQ